MYRPGDRRKVTTNTGSIENIHNVKGLMVSVILSTELLLYRENVHVSDFTILFMILGYYLEVYIIIHVPNVDV